MVEQGELLGQPQRVIERGLEDREADLDPLGGRTQLCGKGRRIGRLARFRSPL
jgi:hypothetical protein